MADEVDFLPADKHKFSTAGFLQLLDLLDLLENLPFFFFFFGRKNWKTISFFIIICWKTGISGFFKRLICPRQDSV